MREILFRGKRKDNGEWVYGCLVTIEASNIKTTDGKTSQRIYCITKPYIPFEITVNDTDSFDLALYRVIPETVGQYTGLTDKNGKKIFEGDIIRGYGVTGKVDFKKGLVWWDALFSQWRTNKECLYGSKHCATYKIIGNIHDNPELLKGGG